MACCEIVCRRCNYMDFTNDLIARCKNCGSTDVQSFFDEYPEDFVCDDGEDD